MPHFIISLYRRLCAVAYALFALSVTAFIIGASTVSGAVVSHFAGPILGLSATVIMCFAGLQFWFRWFFRTPEE
jgi:hypothetical protein